jgi:hypothetical protein
MKESTRILVHTHWSDLSGNPDRPDHYQQVTWTLSSHDGATELTITETNLSSKEAKAVSETSWNTVLDNLKRALDTIRPSAVARQGTRTSFPRRWPDWLMR